MILKYSKNAKFAENSFDDLGKRIVNKLIHFTQQLLSLSMG
jgi:hypothetical protein